jgi:NAD(P)-dependent dehydrogenase (short-subunit alcohol dehydrogenase family)
MLDLFDLTGRKALVTGASRGIGLAIARGLGARGAELVITARRADGLNQAADELRRDGIKVCPISCHQGDPESIARLFQQLDQDGFGPDIIVINAGTNPVMGPLHEIESAAWDKILAVNLTGVLHTVQHAIRRLLPRKKGSIILMASIAGIDPLPGLGAYSVSKAGLIGMMKVLAKELGRSGVRVNAIAPGLVETRFSAALFQDRGQYDRLMVNVPLGRHGQPDDLVGAAIFLASDAAAYITGQVLVVDGGSRV